MPSSKYKLSAFPVTTTGYPCFPYGPQIYHFRRSIARPTHSLHPASPSLQWVAWVSLPHLPGLPIARPSVLRSAKTTASPSRVTSLDARSPVPRQSPFVCMCASGLGTARLPGLFVYRSPFRWLVSRGVNGPLEFPGYPCMHMPRS